MTTTHRHTHILYVLHNWVDRQTGRHTDRQADRQTGWQTDRQTDGQVGRLAGKQADRQIDRLARTHTYKQTNGRTDMTKLIVAFRSFAKEPNKGRMKISARTFKFVFFPEY